MDTRVGLVFLLMLGASWASHARPVSLPDVKVVEVILVDEKEIKGVQEISRKDNVCTLCEQFAAEALGYLSENKTQNEIIEILHQTCSRVPSYQQQCISLVDYYAPLFFLEVSSIQPIEFCRKVNLCQQVTMFSSQLRQDSCEICHHTVSEALSKLKDPDTQLEILELLLKGCNTVEKYVKKCKRMVFEYGPIILANAEQFLETNDICTMLHACSSTASGNEEAWQEVRGPILAES